jgi:hypothetical protein
LLVLLVLNDEPPPPVAVAVSPMVRGPKLPEPKLRAPPPVADTTELAGRVLGPDGAPAAETVVFVSGLDEYDYGRAKGTIAMKNDGKGVEPRVVALQIGQHVSMRAEDARLHTMVVRHVHDPTHVLFNVPVLPSGAEATFTLDGRSFGVHSVQCSIHQGREEPAYVAFFAHPFFAVVGADGRFRFQGLALSARKLHAFRAGLPEQVVALELEREDNPEIEIRLGDG